MVAVLDQPPRAQMALIDRHRRVQQVSGGPLWRTRPRPAIVPALGDDAGRGGRYLVANAKGSARRLSWPCARLTTSELVVRAGAHLRQGKISQTPELAQAAHRFRRPSQPLKSPTTRTAGHPVPTPRTTCRAFPGGRGTCGTEMTPQPLVPALRQQMKVKRPQGWASTGYGSSDFVHEPRRLRPGNTSPSRVVRDISARQAPGEHPRAGCTRCISIRCRQ